MGAHAQAKRRRVPEQRVAVQVCLSFPPGLLARVEAWMDGLDVRPTRSAAVIALIERSLPSPRGPAQGEGVSDE